jgi:hypothetical protein
MFLFINKPKCLQSNHFYTNVKSFGTYKISSFDIYGNTVVVFSALSKCEQNIVTSSLGKAVIILMSHKYPQAFIKLLNGAELLSRLIIARNYRVIRLRCHKKKWKRCRKESALLPVNSTYTCRRDITFVSQHMNTSSLNMTATADGAQFIPRGEFAPRGAQHFRRDLCKGHGDLLSGFVCTQVTWLTPTRKILEASSPGNSRAMGWAHHGRTSDFCMRRLKTPALWEPNVAEPYMDILPPLISNKLLRDMHINFLYTTVYFSNISNGSLCTFKAHNCGVQCNTENFTSECFLVLLLGFILWLIAGKLAPPSDTHFWKFRWRTHFFLFFCFTISWNDREAFRL